MFNFDENSAIVAMYLRNLLMGTITKEQVPMLFNLRDVVYPLYEKELEKQKPPVEEEPIPVEPEEEPEVDITPEEPEDEKNPEEPEEESIIDEPADEDVEQSEEEPSEPVEPEPVEEIEESEVIEEPVEEVAPEEEVIVDEDY